jgi:hypothetical protein
MSLINRSGDSHGEFGGVIIVLWTIPIESTSENKVVNERATQRVPRFIWTFLASCVSLAIGIPGYDHFETVLEKRNRSGDSHGEFGGVIVVLRTIPIESTSENKVVNERNAA